jgi:phosphoglycerate dehydrogenase-like enzyme
MQILMTQSGYDRIGDRLAPLAAGHQIVTVPATDLFEIDGRPVDPETVNAEVVWLSLDSRASGLFRTLAVRLLKSPATRWTQVFSAGLDDPSFQKFMAKGVRISKSSSQAVAIAEYVVGHAVSLLVPIEAQRAAQAAHEWRHTPWREVGHTRWLLVGYGSIGREIARRIKAFGIDLTVVRRSKTDTELADRVVTQAELSAALPNADVVVLACPLTDETRGLADPAFFAAMKPGAMLINIGRGALVDEDALRAGLDRDQPGRAVLDVFATEPLPADSWFWDHPKVRVSAHTSNAGDGNVGRGDDLFLENLRRYLAGEPLLNEAQPREVGL